MTKVIITGANGYIAAHAVKQLLEKGYTVVGTVRTEEKGAALEKLLNNSKFSYEVVPTFLEDDAFDETVKKHPDAVYFLHTASPVIFNAKDPEKDVILPAIHGTVNALKAADKYGKNIKHFVYTSSTAAIYNSQKGGIIKANEGTWNDTTYEEALTNDLATYSGSKTFAEKAAWDYIKENKPQFTFNTVNPLFVFGPQAFDEDAKGSLNFSAGIVEQVLRLKTDDPIPTVKGGAVDVRDVAAVHIAAFENPATEGKRLIAKESFYTSQLLLDLIRKNFPELRDSLPVGEPGSHVEAAKTAIQIDNSATTKLLDIKWIPLEKAVVDLVKQLLANE